MTTPADVMRCAECGIADEFVVNYDVGAPAHESERHCIAAYRALLEQSRPYVRYPIDIDVPLPLTWEEYQEQARALLAKFPVKP